MLIKALDRDFSRPRHERHQSRKAEAAFKKFRELRSRRQLGIDDHVKVDGLPIPFSQLLRSPIFGVLQPVFNYRKLNSAPDLRRRQTNTRCIPHGLFHIGDKFKDLRTPNLLWTQGPRRLPENRITRLDNGKNHGLP
jgi:hypothetical protein